MLCLAPFVHMVQNPDGQFRTCCMYEKALEGNHKDVKDAFDSVENKVIRERMLSGENLFECQKCDLDELHNSKKIDSYRSFFNSTWNKDVIENPSIRSLEISTSNRCNFACVDCGPKYSNQFGPTIDNQLPSEEYYKDLQYLKLLGGEPFLDKRVYDILKAVPRHQIELTVVTNNSIFPSEDTLDLLSEFKNLNLNISIDGIKDVAEYVRYGTKWERFERNFNKWCKFRDNLIELKKDRRCMYLVPHYVLHSLNAIFFDEVVKWSNIDYSIWSWDILLEPHHLNISYLPDKVKNYVLDQNTLLKEPIEKIMNTNEYSKELYTHLMTKHSDAPDRILEYLIW